MTGITRSDPKAHADFFDAIRRQAAQPCPFEVGFRILIACRMAVEAGRQKRTVQAGTP
jgi:hypothetical protein